MPAPEPVGDHAAWVAWRRQQDTEALARAEESGDPLAVEMARDGAAATEMFLTLFPNGITVMETDEDEEDW